MPEATISSRRKRALEEQGQNKNAPRMRDAFLKDKKPNVYLLATAAGLLNIACS